MKQVNFSHSGGFPLEQETLERLQTAYRSELYEAIKRHLSIVPNTNYIIAHAQSGKQGWAVIHQEGEGILYPIMGNITTYLKTTRTITNLIYGDGSSQTAYTDYQAEYVNTIGTPITNDIETINYYDLKDFETVKSIQAIEEIIEEKEGRIKTIEASIPVIDNRIKTIEDALPTIDTRINTIKTDLESYLPLDGSKAMQGDLNLGTHQLYLNNLNAATSNDYLLAVNNQNQVVKNGTLIQSLIGRIETLEQQTPTAVPIGMIAIWGKPAPFPEGWEEYVPLRGRMPVGLDANDVAFNSLSKLGGSKQKKLTIDEMPSHGHDWLYSYERDDDNKGSSYDEFTFNPGNIPQTNLKNPIGKTGGDQPFSLLNPYRVVHFIEYTGNTSDTANPTVPSSLQASNIGTTSLTLTWTESTDNIGVTGYLIYKDNFDTLLADLGKDTLSYNVTGLSANTNYNFYVKAKDAAGNLSDPATLNTKTKGVDITAPTVPSHFSCVHNGQGYVQLEWSPSQDEDSPIDYELSGGSYGFLPILKKNPDTYYNYRVPSNGTYSYKLRAIDPSGNSSAYTETSITINSL